MRAASVVFCAVAVMCGDFVYVLLFPQLTCAIFLPSYNTFGSFVGGLISAPALDDFINFAILVQTTLIKGNS